MASNYQKSKRPSAQKTVKAGTSATALAPNTKPTTPWTDYKTHPVVVLALAVVGTLVFSMTFLVPVFTAKLQNKVDDLTATIERLRQEQKPLRDLVEVSRRGVLLANRQRDEAVIREKALELKDSFSVSDIFPAGWRKVRIGDTQSQLLAQYPDAVRDSRNFWSVKDDTSALFRQATYYFNRFSNPADPQINHVLLFFKDGATPQDVDVIRRVVIAQLTEHFGRPKEVVDEDSGEKNLVWSALSYELTVQKSALHIDSTCATGKALKKFGVKFDNGVICSFH